MNMFCDLKTRSQAMTSENPGVGSFAPQINDSGGAKQNTQFICSEDEENLLPRWVSVDNYIRKPLNASV